MQHLTESDYLINQIIFEHINLKFSSDIVPFMAKH